MQANIKTKLLGAVGGALVLALAAGGVAYASGGSSVAISSTPGAATVKAAATATTTAAPAVRIGRATLRKEIRAVLRHTVHADLIVDTKAGFKTFDADRGTVQSDSSNVLTIKRLDGVTVTTTLTASTRFYGLSASQLAAGDHAIVVQMSGNALVVAAKAPSSSSTAGS